MIDPFHAGTFIRPDAPRFARRTNASIIQEALEGYASGCFQLQVEVKHFLESFPNLPRDRKGEVRNQRVTDLLTKVLYAGYVESGDWEVSLRPGRHEGLITLETHKKDT